MFKKKKTGRLAQCVGQDANPCGAIGITKFSDMKNNFKKMLKCSPGFWQKRELYKIEKSLIVFEKKKILC